MSRDGLRNPHARQRIAQLAARLMVEHGIKDHAFAKRKAARQLGESGASGLPGNEEIDAEVRAYLALFEPDEHEEALHQLRRQALEAMRTLERFQPMLTGALVQGTASHHSDIELELYADSSKEFEQFLLNRNIDFKSEDRRGGPVFTLYSDPADVIVRVLPEQNLLSAPRAGGETRRRMTMKQLQQLLAEDEPDKDVNTELFEIP